MQVPTLDVIILISVYHTLTQGVDVANLLSVLFHYWSDNIQIKSKGAVCFLTLLYEPIRVGFEVLHWFIQVTTNNILVILLFFACGKKDILLHKKRWILASCLATILYQHKNCRNLKDHSGDLGCLNPFILYIIRPLKLPLAIFQPRPKHFRFLNVFFLRSKHPLISAHLSTLWKWTCRELKPVTVNVMSALPQNDNITLASMNAQILIDADGFLEQVSSAGTLMNESKPMAPWKAEKHSKFSFESNDHVTHICKGCNHAK